MKFPALACGSGLHPPQRHQAQEPPNRAVASFHQPSSRCTSAMDSHGVWWGTGGTGILTRQSKPAQKRVPEKEFMTHGQSIVTPLCNWPQPFTNASPILLALPEGFSPLEPSTTLQADFHPWVQFFSWRNKSTLTPIANWITIYNHHNHHIITI